jgi:hypothetical protein
MNRNKLMAWGLFALILSVVTLCAPSTVKAADRNQDASSFEGGFPGGIF